MDILGVGGGFSMSETYSSSSTGSGSGGFSSSSGADAQSSVAALSTASNKQVFGAQVVAKTLDYMHSGGMGSGGMGSMSQTYDFNKSVLGAYAASKGVTTDMMV